MDQSPNNEAPPNDVKLLAYNPAHHLNGDAPLATEEDLTPPTPPPPLSFAQPIVAPPTSFATPTFMTPPPRPLEPAPSTEGRHSEAPSERASLKKRDNLVRDSSRPKPVRGTMHVLSSLYAKLVVAVTAILITTEVLPNSIPLYFFHGYLFTYLLGAGILCILCIYMSLLLQKCPGMEEPDDSECESVLRRRSGPEISGFFRIGALVFGLGTLIAVGLEIATLFSLEQPCVDKLNFVQPVIYALFTFMQMHYLSLNSQKAVQCLGWCRHIVLMHLTATNVAIWLRLVILEGGKTWLDAAHVQLNSTERFPQPGYNVTVHSLFSDGRHEAYVSPNCVWLEQDQKPEGILNLRQCYQNTTIGLIWDKAQPFILPFIVQYCLIGAVVNYILWDGFGANKRRRRNAKGNSWSPRHDVESVVVQKPAPKVDCKGSSKGLFLGLLVLAVGIVVLILFFVLTNNQNLREETLFIMITVHCAFLGISFLGSLFGICRTSSMCTDTQRPNNMHAVLQTIGVFAVYIHGTCSIVVGTTQWQNSRYLVIAIDGAAMILQSIVQSVLFNKICQKNCSGRCGHEESRPGRQIVTFLAFVNLVLWVTESFTDQNHVSSQLQLQFFGVVPWQLLSKIVLPLVMFYRFESSVFLMETWKFGYSTYV